MLLVNLSPSYVGSETTAMLVKLKLLSKIETASEYSLAVTFPGEVQTYDDFSLAAKSTCMIDSRSVIIDKRYLFLILTTSLRIRWI
jgi:hypothetical protein